MERQPQRHMEQLVQGSPATIVVKMPTMPTNVQANNVNNIDSVQKAGKEESAHNLQISLTQAKINGNNLKSNSWILLDTCSTDSISKNKDLISNLCPCSEDKILTISFNGGVTLYNKLAELKVLPSQHSRAKFLKT